MQVFNLLCILDIFSVLFCLGHPVYSIKVVLANDNNIVDTTIGNIINMNVSSSVSLDISLMSFQTVVTIKLTYFQMTECLSSDIVFLHHKT